MVYDVFYIVQVLKYGKFVMSDEKQGKMVEKFGVEVIYF